MFDRHSVVGLFGAISAVQLSTAIDLYTRVIGAGVATLTLIYMIRKNHQQKIKSEKNEK